MYRIYGQKSNLPKNFSLLFSIKRSLSPKFLGQLYLVTKSLVEQSLNGLGFRHLAEALCADGGEIRYTGKMKYMYEKTYPTAYTSGSGLALRSSNSVKSFGGPAPPTFHVHRYILKYRSFTSMLV